MTRSSWALVFFTLDHHLMVHSTRTGSRALVYVCGSDGKCVISKRLTKLTIILLYENPPQMFHLATAAENAMNPSGAITP